MNNSPQFTLEEVEQQLRRLKIPFSSHGAQYKGPFCFKSLRQIEPGGIYFLAEGIPSPPQIENSIILYPENTYPGKGNVILKVENSQLAFYRLMEAMVGDKNQPSGIHPTAIVGKNCKVDPSACIGPYCVLDDCIINAKVNLISHVAVMRGTTIEADVTIEPHSTIGATGVAWIWDPATRRRVIQPQTGYTVIHRGCFLGSGITVVRGSVNETTNIGEGCVIAHGSKIGHGSRIGAECHFANNISVAGNVTLGKHCFLGSGAVVRPQIRLAERTVVGAGAVVVEHSEQPGLVLMGIPAKPTKLASAKMSGVPAPLDT